MEFIVYPGKCEIRHPRGSRSPPSTRHPGKNATEHSDHHHESEHGLRTFSHCWFPDSVFGFGPPAADVISSNSLSTSGSSPGLARPRMIPASIDWTSDVATDGPPQDFSQNIEQITLPLPSFIQFRNTGFQTQLPSWLFSHASWIEFSPTALISNVVETPSQSTSTKRRSASRHARFAL
jgi:hypothetical protein